MRALPLMTSASAPKGRELVQTAKADEVRKASIGKVARKREQGRGRGSYNPKNLQTSLLEAP